MSNPLKIPALDPGSLPLKEGSSYPENYRHAIQGRRWRALGDAVGLTQFAAVAAAGRRGLTSNAGGDGVKR